MHKYYQAEILRIMGIVLPSLRICMCLIFTIVMERGRAELEKQHFIGSSEHGHEAEKTNRKDLQVLSGN